MSDYTWNEEPTPLQANLYFERGVTEDHIREMNLIALDESSASGSLSNVRHKVPIKDGIHVINEIGELVAWGVIFNKKSSGRTEGHICVHPDYRRRKIGSRIYREMRAIHPDFSVCRWDSTSDDFYDHLGAGYQGSHWS